MYNLVADLSEICCQFEGTDRDFILQNNLLESLALMGYVVGNKWELRDFSPQNVKTYDVMTFIIDIIALNQNTYM